MSFIIMVSYWRFVLGRSTTKPSTLITHPVPWLQIQSFDYKPCPLITNPVPWLQNQSLDYNTSPLIVNPVTWLQTYSPLITNSVTWLQWQSFDYQPCPLITNPVPWLQTQSLDYKHSSTITWFTSNKWFWECKAANYCRGDGSKRSMSSGI